MGKSGSLVNSLLLMEFLLSKCADVNRIICDQPMLTYVLSYYGCGAEPVGFLLDHGAHIDVIDYQGRTALMAAVIHYNADAVKLLLERGANVGLCDKDGKTALDFALKYKKFFDEHRPVCIFVVEITQRF